MQLPTGIVFGAVIDVDTRSNRNRCSSFDSAARICVDEPAKFA